MAPNLELIGLVVDDMAASLTFYRPSGTPGDVDATYERLTGLGYDGHLAPWDAFWGQRYAVIRDPDGNSVDLFAPSD